MKRRFNGLISLATLATFLVLATAFVTIIWPKGEKQELQNPEYMVEIRVENKSDERVKNIKFGIVDAKNTLLEDLKFEETDDAEAVFWVGYTNTTVFYLKIRTSDSYVEKTFDIERMNKVDAPQQLLFNLTKEAGVLQIQESL